MNGWLLRLSKHQTAYCFQWWLSRHSHLDIHKQGMKMVIIPILVIYTQYLAFRSIIPSHQGPQEAQFIREFTKTFIKRTSNQTCEKVRLIQDPVSAVLQRSSRAEHGSTSSPPHSLTSSYGCLIASEAGVNKFGHRLKHDLSLFWLLSKSLFRNL